MYAFEIQRLTFLFCLEVLGAALNISQNRGKRKWWGQEKKARRAVERLPTPSIIACRGARLPVGRFYSWCIIGKSRELIKGLKRFPWDKYEEEEIILERSCSIETVRSSVVDPPYLVSSEQRHSHFSHIFFHNQSSGVHALDSFIHNGLIRIRFKTARQRLPGGK